MMSPKATCWFRYDYWPQICYKNDATRQSWNYINKNDQKFTMFIQQVFPRSFLVVCNGAMGVTTSLPELEACANEPRSSMAASAPRKKLGITLNSIPVLEMITNDGDGDVDDDEDEDQQEEDVLMLSTNDRFRDVRPSSLLAMLCTNSL